MADRLVTPSQLALFSRRPLIGAWWEEVHATAPERAPRPQAEPLDKLLFASGLEHERVLIGQLESAGKTAPAPMPPVDQEDEPEETDESPEDGQEGADDGV